VREATLEFLPGKKESNKRVFEQRRKEGQTSTLGCGNTGINFRRNLWEGGGKKKRSMQRSEEGKRQANHRGNILNMRSVVDHEDDRPLDNEAGTARKTQSFYQVKVSKHNKKLEDKNRYQLRNREKKDLVLLPRTKKGGRGKAGRDSEQSEGKHRERVWLRGLATCLVRDRQSAKKIEAIFSGGEGRQLGQEDIRRALRPSERRLMTRLNSYRCRPQKKRKGTLKKKWGSRGSVKPV